MLKYVSANLGLIHTKLDDAIQLQHLIRHPGINANPMNYTEYVALGWVYLLILEQRPSLILEQSMVEMLLQALSTPNK
jgi:hypothetical protein